MHKLIHCIYVLMCLCSPLPCEVFLQEDVSTGLAPPHRRPGLAGLHAHRAGGVRQRAQVLADGARVSRVGVAERYLATIGTGPQVSYSRGGRERTRRERLRKRKQEKEKNKRKRKTRKRKTREREKQEREKQER